MTRAVYWYIPSLSDIAACRILFWMCLPSVKLYELSLLVIFTFKLIIGTKGKTLSDLTLSE